VLATRATTTHGGRVLVVVVVVAAAAADHVRAFQRLYDRRVPVTRALNLHTRAFLHRESKKQDTKRLAITSPTIIRFSIFFH